MSESNLSLGDGATKKFWNQTNAKFPFNNKGFAEGGDGGDGGDGDGGDGGDGGGTGAATLDWRENLDPSIKDHPSLADFKTPAEVAKSYVNAQALIGKEKLPVPGKDADPMAEGGNQEYNTVYDRLGRPSDPQAYELPDIAPIAGLPAVPEETIKGFKELSHKIGLLPHQVKALYQWQHDQTATGMSQNQDSTKEFLQKSETELRKEYGKAFDSNLTGAQGLLKKFGSPEAIAALEQTGMGNNPHIIRMMVNISKQFGEDGSIMAGETQSAILSPSEAQAEVNKIMADKSGAYWNRPDEKTGNKPFAEAEHKAMVKKVQDLMAMAHPGQK